MKNVKVGVNGVGRIGRTILRAYFAKLEKSLDTNFEIVAINNPGEPKPYIHLLKHDSIHGKLKGDFSFNTDWTLTSDRNDGTTVLGGYGLLDLGIQYDLNKHTALQLQWNNVFNKKYTLVRGYNTQGSNVFFNVRLSL